MDELKPKKRRFRIAAERPPAELVARQMEVTALAYRMLGTVDAARSFLNDVDEPLGGRPLDVAGASADGLRRVSAALTGSGRTLPTTA